MTVPVRSTGAVVRTFPVPIRALFMQSELTAVSLQSFPEDTHCPDSLNHLQHGHDVCRDQASGPFLFLRQGETGDYRSPIDPREGSERQSSPPADGASQYGQPYMASPRRQGDIGFEVVNLSSKPRLSLDAFPNGTLTLLKSVYLTNNWTSRGPDSHSFPLTPAFTVVCLACLSPFSQPGYDSSCVEDCFLSLLSWSA